MRSRQVKRIVCLANSRKPGGRCIAGREALSDGSFGRWVRPVSSRDGEAVSEDERQYRGGAEPRLLDLIDVSLLQEKRNNYQTENWLLDAMQRWEKAGAVPKDKTGLLAERLRTLWVNEYSSLGGLNDRIPLDIASRIRRSLCLVQVNDLHLAVSRQERLYGIPRTRLQGRFTHNGAEYWLRVTDPDYENRYRQLPPGNYPVGEAFLTLSLGEPFQGYAYKLIAAIIRPQGELQ